MRERARRSEEKKEEKEKYGEKRAVRRSKKKTERKRETRATPTIPSCHLSNRCNNGKGKRDGRTGWELRDGRESTAGEVSGKREESW